MWLAPSRPATTSLVLGDSSIFQVFLVVITPWQAPLFVCARAKVRRWREERLRSQTWDPPVSETTVMHVLTRHSLYSTQRKYCIKSSYGTKPTTIVVSGYRLTLCSPGCQFESRLSDLLVLGPNLINDKWDPRVLFRYFSVGWFF